MAESWYTVTSADSNIQDGFQLLWEQSGGPVDAALFFKRNQSAKAWDYYFNPAAARIASKLLQESGAIPCEAPDPPRQGDLRGLALCVGDQAILERPWELS